MKKAVLIAVAMSVVAGAKAFDYPYLTFTSADGSEKSIAVESLTMTFSNGQLVAQNSDSSVTFTLESLSKMYFAVTPAGIGDINADSENGPVTAYSLLGAQLGSFESVAEAESSLQSGIYVIKFESGKTQKIAVR